MVARIKVSLPSSFPHQEMLRWLATSPSCRRKKWGSVPRLSPSASTTILRAARH
jgi:hypothetical protein